MKKSDRRMFKWRSQVSKINKDKLDEIYDGLKIGIATSIVIKAPDNIELNPPYFFDKKDNLILIKYEKIDTTKFEDFVFLFANSFESNDISKEIKKDIEWTCKLIKKGLDENDINSMLNENYTIRYHKFKQIPIINPKKIKEHLETHDIEIEKDKEEVPKEEFVETPEEPSEEEPPEETPTKKPDTEEDIYGDKQPEENGHTKEPTEKKSETEPKKETPQPFTFEELKEKCKNPAPDTEERDETIIELTKASRNMEFGKAVKQLYEDKCAVCGLKIYDLKGNPEAQWAHIRPVRKPHNGPDDIRNGLALCRLHHWAFDRGLFTLSNDFKIIVKSNLPKEGNYESLTKFAGKTIFTLQEPFKPALKFIKYHQNQHGF